MPYANKLATDIRRYALKAVRPSTEAIQPHPEGRRRVCGKRRDAADAPNMNAGKPTCSPARWVIVTCSMPMMFGRRAHRGEALQG